MRFPIHFVDNVVSSAVESGIGVLGCRKINDYSSISHKVLFKYLLSGYYVVIMYSVGGFIYINIAPIITSLVVLLQNITPKLASLAVLLQNIAPKLMSLVALL